MRTPTLPNGAALEAVTRTQAQAHDALEAVTRDVKAYVDAFEVGTPRPDPMPSMADVGELFLIAYHTRLRAAELIEFADELERALPVLGEIPANAAIRAAA